MAENDAANHMPLADLLEVLGEMGFLFRTQGVEGDEFVPAEEIVSDLRHGDMAEMLAWYADWNHDTLTVTVVAPEHAVEAPGVPIEFHAQRASVNFVQRSR